MAKPTIANLYNPKNLDKTTLIKGFVVRLQQFQDLFEDLKQGDWTYPQDHIMIEAQRGMGKTTLLWRLKYEIEQDENLQKWLLPVVFNEEEYGLRNLASIWELVAEILEQHAGFEGLVDEMETLYEDDDIAFERAIFKLLIQRLQGQKKKILLVIENFGDVLKKFSKQEVQRLRTILQSCADLRLIIASPIVLESFFKYDHSFYSFFRKVSLKGLNEQETKNLLLQLGELYKEKEAVERVLQTQQGKVEALRRLTGGIIRTIVLLFEIFVDDVQGTAFRDLEKIADRVTPFYKDRIDDLPKNQQLIVDAMAKNWDAISVKELVPKTRLASKVISAQLNQLVKNGWITKVPTPTKNKLYYIKERFFNIWFLMRFSRRGDKKKVLWLTRFYEIFCTKKELNTRIGSFISKLSNDAKNTETVWLKGIAMSEVEFIDIATKKKLIKALYNYLSKHNKSLLKHFSKEDIELLSSDNIDKDSQLVLTLFKKFRMLFQAFSEEFKLDFHVSLADFYRIYLKDYEKAKNWYLQGIKKAINKNIINIYANKLAILYQNQFQDYEKSEKYYLQAIELGNEYAIKNLAILYVDCLKDYEKAKEWFLKGIEHEYKEENKHKKHECLNWLAILYQNQFQDYEKAEEYYLQAIELGNEYAIKNLALLYCHSLKDYEKAKKWFLKGIEHKYKKENKHKKHECLNSLAILYANQFQDYEKSEQYFLQAIELDNEYTINNLADLYADYLKDYEKAKEWYLKGIEHNYKEENKHKKYQCLNSLAWMYYQQKMQKKEALLYALESYKELKENYIAHTLAAIQLWNNQFSNSWKTAQTFLYDKSYLEDYFSDTQEYFLLLLGKKQYNYLYEYFTSEQGKKLNTKDRFKPIYYALMQRLKDQYPLEHLRMPPELKETVEEVQERADKLAEEYR